jgi:hypothetical protein
MGIYKHGEHVYSDSQADIRTTLLDYSTDIENVATHYADAVCSCGSKRFKLMLDDNEGAAVRICQVCQQSHPICDSDAFLEEAELEECICLCGRTAFEITVGVSTDDDNDDVRWLFVGCRCIACGLTGCYGDWKSEAGSYKEMLKRV